MNMRFELDRVYHPKLLDPEGRVQLSLCSKIVTQARVGNFDREQCGLGIEALQASSFRIEDKVRLKKGVDRQSKGCLSREKQIIRCYLGPISI